MDSATPCRALKSHVNPSRQLGICTDCARRDVAGDRGDAMAPPAEHDGQRWVCAMRVERAATTHERAA